MTQYVWVQACCCWDTLGTISDLLHPALPAFRQYNVRIQWPGRFKKRPNWPSYQTWYDLRHTCPWSWQAVYVHLVPFWDSSLARNSQNTKACWTCLLSMLHKQPIKWDGLLQVGRIWHASDLLVLVSLLVYRIYSEHSASLHINIFFFLFFQDLRSGNQSFTWKRLCLLHH